MIKFDWIIALSSLTHTHTLAHTYIFMRTHAYAQLCTNMPINIHMHTHTDMYACTHTPVFSLSPPKTHHHKLLPYILYVFYCHLLATQSVHAKHGKCESKLSVKTIQLPEMMKIHESL